jgi:hypothetical protein
MKKRWELLIKLVVIAVCAIAAVLLIQTDNDSSNLNETYFMYAKVDGHKIQIFERQGQYYLFLPGYVKDEDVKLSAEAKNHDIQIVRSANIATIFITTNSGSLENIYADKAYKEAGKMTIIDENGNVDTAMGLEYIKGRGNYSWNTWDKKPFKIKLKEGRSVLGLGEGQNYALIANASDATLIRNDIARKLEQEVGIPYAASGKFVDLYINGDYMGNYYFCASIGVGPERIDITDMDIVQEEVFSGIKEESFEVYETATRKAFNIPECLEDITGGYLVEREFGDRYDLEYSEMRNGFVTENDEHYVVMCPKYCTVGEIDYIYNFFNEAEKEILGNDPYGQYIDVPSFAKRYLVEEVIKNYDGGVSSAFYYKDSDEVDPKLYAGPGWDFDMSLGNYLDWMEYADDDAKGITQLYLSEHNSIYYKNMIKHKEFTELVKQYYKESVVDYMNNLVDSGIDEYEEMLHASSVMDSIRWADMYEEWGYTTADNKEYDKLKSFIAERTAFLSGEWLK